MHYHEDNLSWKRIEQRCIFQVFGEMQKRYTQIFSRNETVHTQVHFYRNKPFQKLS